MITLARHIRALLVDNDCVIVPGLGGFIAHYAPASWVEEEKTFLPPTRMIGFNPQLQINDGLLVQSYMKTEGLNFAEASEKLRREVIQLTSHLHAKGEIMLADIGHLRLSVYNTFEFLPAKCQVQVPGLFGFAPLKMQKISALQSSPKLIPLHPSPARSGQKQTLKRIFSASFLSNAIAIVAIILLFFTLSIPVENTEVVKGNYAQMFPTDMFGSMTTQSLAMTPLAIREPDQSTKELTIVKPSDKPQVNTTPNKPEQGTTPRHPETISQPSAQPTPTPARAKNYHIIVASVGTSHDAKNMAEQLAAKGFPHAQAIIGDGKMRVCIDSYASEAEAYRELNKLRQDETYKNAWILKKKLKK